MQVRIMLALLLLAQLADLVTFSLGVSMHGIHLESNPFAVFAYSLAGTDGVVLMKGVAILVVLGTLVATAARFPRLLVWGAATASAFGLFGVLANVLSLLILSRG